MQEFNNIAQLNCFKISAKQTLKSNSIMPIYMHVYLLPDVLKMPCKDCVVCHHYDLQWKQYPFLLPWFLFASALHKLHKHYKSWTSKK